MGCCCSSESEETGPDSVPNERTRLIQDPAANPYQVNISSNEYGNHYTTSVNQKSDEHSALNKVLQQTANKVIDVGALDCQALEEQEYIERAKNYAHTINKINIPQKLLKKKSTSLLEDISSAEKVLASRPISSEDLALINEASHKVSSALRTIQVVHKEELVVPFGHT